ncbi:MAG: transposase [Desulfovibrio sp.]|nr:transposase [Desulfovibrio sp.]
MPKGCRWPVLKNRESKRTEEQEAALKELEARGMATATAFRVKELLRGVKDGDTKRTARWRFTHLIRYPRELIGTNKLLEPVRKSLQTCETHMPRILRRWESLPTNAHMESLNSLFQAARLRSKGYRNVHISSR